MNNSVDKLQALLLDHSPNYAAFRVYLTDIQKNLAYESLAKSSALLRLSIALQELEEKRAGTADIAVLLRQVIRAYKRRLRVKRALWQLLSSHEQETGLRVTDDTDPDTVELQATSWQPFWLPDTHIVEIDQLQQRRFDTPAVGTGLLYALTQETSQPFIHYKSDAQKIAVETSLFMPPGATTLITLPTGDGKSMCITLPAWFDSQGGRIKGGTTLVVVPTVSLAYDQEKQAVNYFAQAADPEYKPHSLTGATPQDVRDTIRRGLRYGTLPILYTSPESLLNSELHQICLEVAEQGTINRLVIDEAHIVETWGARFRTEFQLLAGYRQQLMDASQGQLRTLLLSATVSNSCRQTLKTLFANNEPFFTLQANRLRPEISYWFNNAPDEEARQTRVLEALRHLPRPVILYVTKPEVADQWVDFLREEGFERVAAFSGKTASDERERIINEWNNNRRDIMVATSAFGLGVDKSDVRAIIHAALPENIDRFYQEVGRSGRDGCSSISLVCLTKEDDGVARGMTTTARITPEKAWGRWRGMWRTAQSYRRQGNRWLINIDAVPDYNREMDESQMNQEWNEHVLLLMQRAGIMQIIDTQPEDGETSEQAAETDENSKPRWLLMELLEPKAIDDEQRFKDSVAPQRQKERRTIDKMLRQMRDLASAYNSDVTKLPKHCLAYKLADLYEPTTLTCGGCFSCRRNGHSSYSAPPEINLDTAELQPSERHLNADLKQRVGHRRVHNLIWDESRRLETLRGFQDLLVDLVGVGIQQLILPQNLVADSTWISDLIKKLAQHRRIPHRLVPGKWLFQNYGVKRLLYPIPTAVLYPIDNESADQIYVALADWLDALSNPVWMTHIVHSALYLPSQLGHFRERVNGLDENVQDFQAWLKRSQTSLLF